MPDPVSDLKQAATDAQAQMTNTRRQIVGETEDAVKDHPKTVIYALLGAVAIAAIVVAVVLL